MGGKLIFAQVLKLHVTIEIRYHLLGATPLEALEEGGVKFYNLIHCFKFKKKM